MRWKSEFLIICFTLILWECMSQLIWKILRTRFQKIFFQQRWLIIENNIYKRENKSILGADKRGKIHYFLFKIVFHTNSSNYSLNSKDYLFPIVILCNSVFGVLTWAHFYSSGLVLFALDLPYHIENALFLALGKKIWLQLQCR